MNTPSLVKLLFSVVFCISLFSCKTDGDNGMLNDNFDRAQMLDDWSTHIIIPSYNAYLESLNILKDEQDAFYTNPNESTFQNWRSSFINAYDAWQSVSMFEIGKAETISLRNYANIYPADTDKIDEHISSQKYNLELPSTFDTQGLPCLDYLLFGIAESESEIIQILILPQYSNYINDVVDRLYTLTLEVVMDWNNGFQMEFISSSGSSATASVDKVVNDFMFYYEKFLRAGKVGIPAGVFSSNPIPTSVEGLFAKNYSKQFFESGYTAFRNFYNGQSFDNQTQIQSLKAYLEHVSNDNTSSNITSRIDDQWDAINVKIQDVSSNFNEQVLTDNTKMLALYDELQKLVVLLKVDAVQALNIQIDFVDADGD